jgi:leucyl/phenylalanyl-tRNA--protein transferase
MVLQPKDFKLHRSLKKTLHRFIQTRGCEIKMDHDFLSVIRHCASSKRAGQRGTWITPEMIQAYFTLHLQGHAHSVETWIDGQLVGGLYCVSIGRTIFGESMFSLASDASKIALSALVCFAQRHQVDWIDCQQETAHMSSLGAKPIERDTFLKGIAKAQLLPAPEWHFKPEHWSEWFMDVISIPVSH